jgi:hypothetical protein
MPHVTKLKPGPLRDVLGHLTSCRRADEWVDVHWLSARTGVPYVNMRERVYALTEFGLVEMVTEARGELFQATAEGQAMVDA